MSAIDNQFDHGRPAEFVLTEGPVQMVFVPKDPSDVEWHEQLVDARHLLHAAITSNSREEMNRRYKKLRSGWEHGMPAFDQPNIRIWARDHVPPEFAGFVQDTDDETTIGVFCCDRNCDPPEFLIESPTIGHTVDEVSDNLKYGRIWQQKILLKLTERSDGQTGSSPDSAESGGDGTD